MLPLKGDENIFQTPGSDGWTQPLSGWTDGWTREEGNFAMGNEAFSSHNANLFKGEREKANYAAFFEYSVLKDEDFVHLSPCYISVEGTFLFFPGCLTHLC